MIAQYPLTDENTPLNILPFLRLETPRMLKQYGGSEVVKMSFEAFTQETSDLLIATAQAIKANDYETTKRHFHSIKGSAASLGLEQIAEQARRAELQTMQDADPQKLATHQEALIDLYQKYRQNYAQYMAQI
ncbi:MAG: Hpt domain-containing protein [Bernardetiaceae bacterium]|nr:Hpt domain-containing protein [Bernardetiaceae bacterium]